jgi:hypothetical protein
MKKIALSLVAFLPAPALAASLLSLQVEPIVGYERVQKLVPTAHTKSRLIYGARLIAGLPLLSAEAELTRGTDDESFPDQGLTTKDTADKLKLGLRSGFGMGMLLRFTARGGVQATRNRHEETTGGVTTSALEPTRYKPYAGAGLRARLAPKITASAEAVVVFNDINDLKQNEYQTTAGFAIRFP